MHCIGKMLLLPVIALLAYLGYEGFHNDASTSQDGFCRLISIHMMCLRSRARWPGRRLPPAPGGILRARSVRSYVYGKNLLKMRSRKHRRTDCLSTLSCIAIRKRAWNIGQRYRIANGIMEALDIASWRDCGSNPRARSLRHSRWQPRLSRSPDR